jgi:hypothetical protein
MNIEKRESQTPLLSLSAPPCAEPASAPARHAGRASVLSLSSPPSSSPPSSSSSSQFRASSPPRPSARPHSHSLVVGGRVRTRVLHRCSPPPQSRSCLTGRGGQVRYLHAMAQRRTATQPTPTMPPAGGPDASASPPPPRCQAEARESRCRGKFGPTTDGRGGGAVGPNVPANGLLNQFSGRRCISIFFFFACAREHWRC